MRPQEILLWEHKGKTFRRRIIKRIYSDGSVAAIPQELGPWPKYGVPEWFDITEHEARTGWSKAHFHQLKKAEAAIAKAKGE